MADTTLPAVTAEVTTPTLHMADGKPTATSLQVAEHFGKQHKTVLRAIRNLGCSAAFTERNLALSEFVDSTGRRLPMYHITRDGFALLAMGFTGKEAMRWKEAYIAAFNAMEARLKNLYVEPLVDDKQFRNGMWVRPSCGSTQLPSVSSVAMNMNIGSPLKSHANTDGSARSVANGTG